MPLLDADSTGLLQFHEYANGVRRGSVGGGDALAAIVDHAADGLMSAPAFGQRLRRDTQRGGNCVDPFGQGAGLAFLPCPHRRFAHAQPIGDISQGQPRLTPQPVVGDTQRIAWSHVGDGSGGSRSGGGRDRNPL